MKKAKLLLTGILFLIFCPAYAWRIEGNILIIEKGDNLSKIAHSLYAKGYDYKKLWQACLDTNLSKNPNVIYRDMRFNIDLLKQDTVKLNDAGKINPDEAQPIYLLKEGKDFDWLNLLTAFLAALIGAFAAYRVAKYQLDESKKNETDKQKKAATFDFHREFHSETIHKHRSEGNKLVIKNKAQTQSIFSDFEMLSMSDEAGTNSIFVVFNFYNRLWVAQHNNQLNDELVPKLFGDIFFYWYDYCFGLGITEGKEQEALDNTELWQSYKNVILLKLWLQSNMDKKEDGILVCRKVNEKYMIQEVIKHNAKKTLPATSNNLPVYQVEIKYDELKKQVIDELTPKIEEELKAKYELIAKKGD